MSYLPLIFPAIIAILAVTTGKYLFKALQTALCIAIVLTFSIIGNTTIGIALMVAFVFSIAGDYFLSYKERNDMYFVYGVALYLLAHIGYMVFCLQYRINVSTFIITLCITLLLFMGYIVLRVGKYIDDRVLFIAVLIYMIISCIVLSLAIGLVADAVVRTLSIAGVALIVFSDTVISEVDFVGKERLGWLILPSYYLAQILLTSIVIYYAVH